VRKRNIEYKQWFVIYVKVRQEFKVAERLENIGIQTFLPYKKEIRQWSDRKKKIKVPLLPSMLLVFVEEKDIPKIFTVPGPVRFLFEQGKRATVSEEEITAMQHYLSGKFEEKSLCVGDTVVVPSLQQEAEVLRIQGKKCLAKLQQFGAVVSFQLS